MEEHVVAPVKAQATRARLVLASLLCLALILLTLNLLVMAQRESRPTVSLRPMGWAPRNHAVITQLLQDYGRGSTGYDSRNRPYAVFDWDDTSAFHDCGDALFRYQLWNLGFDLSKEEFRALFDPKFKKVRANVDAREVELGDVQADIIADYDYLDDHFRGMHGEQSLDQVRGAPEYQDFITKMLFLFDAYLDSPDIGRLYAYPWVLYFLAGQTPEKAQQMARVAITEQLSEALRKVTWKGPKNLDRKAGPIDVSFVSGLRVHGEMQDLMGALRAAEIDVYIVTASLKLEVEIFAGKGFGYNVLPENVLGIELETKDGKLQAAHKPESVSYGQGKVDTIRRVLGSRGDPIFAAGDSDGDYQMLSAFPGTKLALILNRNKGGKIGELCKQAVSQEKDDKPRYILQGRDENTGLFVPGMNMIPLR